MDRYAGGAQEFSKGCAPFSSHLDDSTVAEIMQVDGIDDTWKLLLLMGIGVFSEHHNPRYTEIMKELVQQQRLYLIIASTDYIYGTNYQFCHGYIGSEQTHRENLGKVSKMFNELLRIKNITIDVKSTHDIDDDFVFMCRAKYFESANGGFSSLIQEVRM